MDFPVDGATLRVEVDGPGRGTPVLLWNGAGCTLRMWDPVIPRLQNRYRTIRFDVRGVGGSTPAADPARQYTFEQYAEDVNLILDAHNVAECHVWSMAWGTRAAIAYCSMHPSRVLSAALFDANIGPADTAAQRTGAEKAREKQAAAGIEPFPFPEGWNEHRHPDAVPAAMAAAARFELSESLARLTMPVLVATGDHDPNLAPSRSLVAQLPGARLVVMKNVGHGSVLQRPDLTTQVFLDFQASL